MNEVAVRLSVLEICVDCFIDYIYSIFEVDSKFLPMIEEKLKGILKPLAKPFQNRHRLSTVTLAAKGLVVVLQI